MRVARDGATSVERSYDTPIPRFGGQFALDVLSWAVGIVFAEVFRYEFALGQINWLSMVGLILAAAILQFGVGWLFHLYRGRFADGTFEEVSLLASTAVITALILAIPVVGLGPALGIPRSTMFIALPIALLFMFSSRYLKRLITENRTRRATSGARALVYGAGYLGSSLVRRMLTDSHTSFVPVGLIDDDRRKRNARVRDISVLGTLDDLPAAVDDTGAEVLIVAIARADADLLRRVDDIARELGIQTKVMPPLDQVLDGKSRPSDARDISIEDIIGRHPVDTSVESIAGYLEGKRVLITGAGGSIGSELCRQVLKYGPSELIMLDRDETGLQGAQLGTAGHGLLDTPDVVLADIRDLPALKKVFDDRRPEVVFHAAALKHLPMLEQYPDEAWKTNVIGTLNVLTAARESGVNTFVNVSTDKAANPTSVLGHSKRVAEKLTAWMADETGLRYLSVRFGNVIGSRGSMLPTFAWLIERGGPLTVTHPDATRYFMTIPEACQLVVQAGGIGKPREVLILDMGEPVRILDVAERMIAMSGKDIEIIYTGLREGEKLHEELIGTGETDERPFHPKISHTRIDGIDPDHLDKQGWERRAGILRVSPTEVYE